MGQSNLSLFAQFCAYTITRHNSQPKKIKWVILYEGPRGLPFSYMEEFSKHMKLISIHNINSLSEHLFSSHNHLFMEFFHNEILLTTTNVEYLNFVEGTTSNCNYNFLDDLMFTVFHNK